MGEGKRAAVTEFAKLHRFPLKNCHAYANGNEDVPFLEAVGLAHPVNQAPTWPVTPLSTDGRSCGSRASEANSIRWRWPAPLACSAASPRRWARA